MSLISPAWLLLSALALLVLVLHMQRRRTIGVPSILIWERLASPVRPRSSLRPPPFSWPLVLQIAVVLLAAAAFARPLIGGASLPDHRIVVIDASGSMRATDLPEDRFAAAVERARAMLASIPPSDASRVSVLVAGGEPRLIAARYAGDRGLAASLSALTPTDGPADWRAAGDLARSTLIAGESVGLTILTDDEVAAQAMSALLPAATTAIVPVLGEQPAANAGLTATLRPPVEEGRPWRAEGKVAFSGETRSATVRVLFQPEGTEGFLDWASVEAVAPGEASTAAFKFDLDLPGAGILAIEVPADLANHDDRLSFIVLGEPTIARVLHLGPPNPALERALLASGVVELFAADALPADDNSFDLVVVDNVALSRHPATNTLFLGGGRITGEPEPAGIANPVPSHWRTDHPLAHSVAWPELEAAIGYRLPSLPGASVLLEAAGAPLIEARTTPEGREIRVGLDLRSAAWSEQPGFPVFVGNVLRWLGLSLGGRLTPICEAAIRCPVDPRLALGTVVAPDGSRTTLWPAGVPAPTVLPSGYEPTFIPRNAGIYRIERDGRSQILAVNAPASEVGLPGPSTATLPPEAGPPTPLRWWLLALMLLVLLVEAWISGRGTERFLHRAALARSTPFHGRRRALLGLRVAAIALTVAALLDLRLPILPTGEEVVAVASAEEANAVATRLGEAGARVGMVELGADPVLLADIGSRTRPADDAAAPGADIERAIALAAALLPSDRPGRIVLFTAGAETSGDMLAALATAPTRPIDVIASPMPAPDIVVSTVSAASPLFAGDSFPLAALVFSPTDAPATLRVTRDGESLAEQPVDLLAGWNRLETMIREAPAGEALYEVEIAASGDPQPADNRNGLWLDVESDPAIAILSPDPEAGKRLVDALALQGLTGTVIAPSAAPSTLRGWLAYDAVILANTPAIDLDTVQMEQIETAVSEHGRGLLILGGENSFGPGGYYQTPLERLSPLSSRVPRDAPKVALGFVLDRSGSMQQRIGEVSRLDIAKQAALAAIELLHEESEIAIVVFDSEARTLVPLGPNNDLPSTAAALALLDPGGGTSIYPGMALAFEELRGSDAAARHMIVMTDGLSEPGDFGGIITAIGAEGITVSTVAISEGADIVLLEALARMGGGAFHQTQDFAALPSILSLEAMMLSGAPTEQRLAQPVWQDRSQPFLAGLPETLPPVTGFVLTTAKPDADLHLTVTDTSGEQMPLLASWRYGNGHVAAFTSHGAGVWTAGWLATPEFPLLWGQIARHFLPESERGNLAVDLARDGDEAVLEVLAGDGDGGLRGNLTLIASIAPRASGGAPTLPAGETVLREVATGRYVGRLPAPAPGDYTIHVAGGEESRDRLFHVAFPALLDHTAYDPARPAALALLSSGRDLGGVPWTAIGERGFWTWHPGWPALTLLALGLFLTDLVIRYAPGLFRRWGAALRPA